MYGLPRGRLRALWQVLSASAASGASLARAGRQIRKLASALYQPLVEAELPARGPAARYIGWMLLMSFWAMFQMVDDGELSPEEGIALNVWMLRRLINGARDPAPDLAAGRAPPAEEPATPRPRRVRAARKLAGVGSQDPDARFGS